jgi:hypothetical protein
MNVTGIGCKVGLEIEARRFPAIDVGRQSMLDASGRRFVCCSGTEVFEVECWQAYGRSSAGSRLCGSFRQA